MRMYIVALLACVATVSWADNPGLGAYYSDNQTGGNIGGAQTAAPAATTPAASTPATGDAAAAGAKRSCQAVCYTTRNPGYKGCPKQACLNFAAQNPGYFDRIDQSCQLPQGTAITMAGIESSCSTGANSPNGGKYKGIFQFSTTSCTKGDLRDINVQAACMCEYTANSRRTYEQLTGGKEPSAGMYYLIHQQGTCGVKLALGGSARAVDVISQCVASKKCGRGSSGCAASMSYAQKAIGWNLPKSSGMDASSVSAEQFANLYLSKFSAVDNNSICAGDGAPATAAGTTPTSPAQVLQTLVTASGVLTGDGTQLSAQTIQNLLGMKDLAVLNLLTPLFNPRYDEPRNGYGDDSDEDEAPATEKGDTKVIVSDNSDGTKTATVTVGEKISTYQIGKGSQLWQCESGFQNLKASDETTVNMVTQSCELVAEVEAAAAVTSPTTAQ